MYRPILLTLLGLAAARVPVGLGMPDLPAVVVFCLLGAAAVWGVVSWRLRRRGLLLGMLPAAVLAGYGFWFFLGSAYGSAKGVPAAGSAAPDITATRVRDGARFSLAAQRGSGVLLVFFRGEW